jgi:enoyl-CoA hydratase
MELLLTGDAISAQTAYGIGLVNDIVERKSLMDRAMQTARRIASNGPLAVRAVKRTVMEAVGVPLQQGYALEDATRSLVMATEDSREGPRAFMEKRAPQFSGR